MTLRVLIVDQNAERADAVRAGLEANGCLVVGIAPDAVDLVARVREAAADVIVCDLDSPSRDAIESMRVLNRDEPRPVVMFVDRSDPESIHSAMDAGVAAYVIEGLAPGRVRSVVDVAVARFKAHQALKRELEEARDALSERKMVERAKGILMRGRAMNEDEAYRTMRRMAMDQGKRLIEIASSVVAMESVLAPRGRMKKI
jgi:response regulator NasT